jgi:hypothetical protein
MHNQVRNEVWLLPFDSVHRRVTQAPVILERQVQGDRRGLHRGLSDPVTSERKRDGGTPGQIGTISRACRGWG